MFLFLKLGGSLITDKNTPRTARLPMIRRLLSEIQAACSEQADLQILLGHGSGSFGHQSAKQHGTRLGVHTPEQWQGFAEVWRDARALNEIILQEAARINLPLISFPPSACITAQNGSVQTWNLFPITSAIQSGLIPLVYGDVIFDRQKGGTILSTEDLFFHLARQLSPQRILLAGIEDGVWEDYPARTRLLDTITSNTYSSSGISLQGSESVDVTGGMVSKVETMLKLTRDVPGLSIQIYSGLQPDLTRQVLLGKIAGTTIRDG